MKKSSIKSTFIFIILITVVLLSTSCYNKETYNQLKTLYPDAQIKQNGNGFDVVSENLPYSQDNIDNKQIMGSGTVVHTYITYDELYSNTTVCDSIIFLGKKIGESKQMIPVNSEGTVDAPCFTESKVEVIKPYYGDIQTGQEIIYHEYYAVFTNEKGETTLNYIEGEYPVDDNIYIYVLYQTEDSELYNDKKYVDYIPPINPDNEAIAESAKTLIEKYYINNDTKIDKAELAKAIVKRNDELGSEVLGITEATDKEKISKCSSLSKSDSLTYEQYKEGLTDEQIALIERISIQYGEKTSSLAVK